jgi:hypothetical protein
MEDVCTGVPDAMQQDDALGVRLQAAAVHRMATALAALVPLVAAVPYSLLEGHDAGPSLAPPLAAAAEPAVRAAPPALRRFLVVHVVDVSAAARTASLGSVPPRLRQLLQLAADHASGWVVRSIVDDAWILPTYVPRRARAHPFVSVLTRACILTRLGLPPDHSVLERLALVAVRDRAVLPTVVRHLLPLAPAAGGWTWCALERWLWVLLVQRCEAAALTAQAAVAPGGTHLLASLVNESDAHVRLCMALPGAYEPSPLQQRLWTTLLHRYGCPVRLCVRARDRHSASLMVRVGAVLHARRTVRPTRWDTACCRAPRRAEQPPSWTGPHWRGGAVRTTHTTMPPCTPLWPPWPSWCGVPRLAVAGGPRHIPDGRVTQSPLLDEPATRAVRQASADAARRWAAVPVADPGPDRPERFVVLAPITCDAGPYVAGQP